MGFNLEDEKFKSQNSETLSLAIDRAELVDILYFGHGKACSGPFSTWGRCTMKNFHTSKQDITKAKALLKETCYDEKILSPLSPLSASGSGKLLCTSFTIPISQSGCCDEASCDGV